MELEVSRQHNFWKDKFIHIENRIGASAQSNKPFYSRILMQLISIIPNIVRIFRKI